jgi:hypothetical protein
MISKDPQYNKEVAVIHEGIFRKGFFFSENLWDNKILDFTNVWYREHIATCV